MSINDEKELTIDKKIIRIIDEYFSSLEKFIKTMDDYFNINKEQSSSSYIITWLQQQIQVMTKNIEGLFVKITSIVELKLVMRHINKVFNELDAKGSSGKYIFDLYFINNIKISLESIINFCMKSEKEGVSFDLKEYQITHNNKTIKINCVSELGNAVYNVFQIISDFITDFVNNRHKFIGIIFIEEYFFDQILSIEFLNFLKNKITKNMNNNYDVKPFHDNQESLATSNQILINYGISILSIEALFDFFLLEMESNKEVSSSSLESIKNIKIHINDTKNLYFSNLFKHKVQNHFFKYFDTNKQILAKDLPEDISEPDRVYLVFFYLVKNLAKTIKMRVSDPVHVQYFVLDNQFMNFLKIISSLKNLDKLYDTEFNFSKLGVFGLETIIYGIYVTYLAIQKVLGFDEEGKFKQIVENFIDEFINDFGKERKISVERLVKNRKLLYDNALKYITENRVELIKGY